MFDANPFYRTSSEQFKKWVSEDQRIGISVAGGSKIRIGLDIFAIANEQISNL